ncbi:DUF1801 domain-containing protein [Cohnella sp. GCM10027633]|uniref:DUF1801 domain-containing protein n=1 Tax=unclassified Cohnella TaxID=2636738 RepID=UPI00363C8705
MGDRINTKQNTEKLTGSEQVVAFMQKLEHPLKLEIEEVRKIILQSDSQITEHMKWNAPSFCILGEDRITFNFYGGNKFRLVFHCGAKKTANKENKGKLIADDSGLLEWAADDRATIAITSSDDLNEEKRNSLKVVITKWIEATRRL